MIKITQKNGTPTEGDCFPTSIASILEVPLEVFPTHECKKWNVHNWQRWLSERGITLYGPPRNRGVWYQGQWIAIVPSINNEGGYHALVMEDGHLAWDPNCNRKYESVDINDVKHAWLLILSDMTKFRLLLEQVETSRSPLNV